MTHAVLLAGRRAHPGGQTGAALTPLVDGSVVGRLRDQLRSLGAGDCVVLARPHDAPALRAEGLRVQESPDLVADLQAVAGIAEQAAGPLLLCAADLLASDTSVGAVVAAAANRNVALVDALASGEECSPLQPPVVSQRGRLVRVDVEAAPSSVVKTVFRGLLAASPQQVHAAARACAPEPAMAPTTPDVKGRLARAAVPEADDAPDALGLILRSIVRAGEPVLAQRTRGLPSRRVADAATAAELLRAWRGIAEDDVRMRLAVKRRDDLFATYCVSSFSPRVVRWAARWGLTPTIVTWLSVAMALLAAAGFAHGDRPWLVAGAVLLYVSFVLDCVDGQLARYLQRHARFGGWLDSLADRGKEYIVYAGLAIGAARHDVADAWPLALAAMVLLTTRNMADAWYGALQGEMLAMQARGVRASTPPPRGMARIGAALPDASPGAPHTDRRSLLYWLKRSLPLPIGERWMVIAVTTPLFGARVAFLVLLGWGAVAASYVLGGRALRALQQRVVVMPTVDRPLYRDDGVLAMLLGRVGARWLPWAPPLGVSLLPALIVAAGTGAQLWGAPVRTGQVALAAAVGFGLAGIAARRPHDGALDWLLPAALRISEYAMVILLGHYAGVPAPLIFTLVFMLVMFHYDLTVRLERNGSPVTWRALALGWDVRIAVLAGAVLIGAAMPVYLGLAAYLGVLFLVSATMGAAAASRRAAAPFTPPLPRQGGRPLSADVELSARAERAY